MNGSDRYAKALFSLDKSQEMDSLLASCVDLMHNSPLFTPFFTHPEVNLEAKERVLKSCVENPLLVRFLLLLIQRNRWKELPIIAQAYHTLYLDSEGLVEARLVTAFPTDQETQNKLRHKLERTFHAGFILQTEVNPDLMGGAVLYVGNSLLDYSLKGRLNTLKNDLLRKNHAAET